MTDWQSVLLPLWLTAFMAGVLGSGHCFAMCGGIAGSLGVAARRNSNSGKSGSVRTGQGNAGWGNSGEGKAGEGRHLAATAWKALQFNLGRICGYAITGALIALLLGSFSRLPGLQWLAVLLRGMSGLLVLLIGFRFLFDWRGLDVIERCGALVWMRVAPLANRFATSSAGAGRFMLGLCWGFLPCGLVYTLLLTAASTANAATGASVMLAFGLGTLPSMLGLTLAAPALATVLKDRDFRRFIGLSLVLLAAWMLFSTYSMGGFGPAVEGSAHRH